MESRARRERLLAQAGAARLALSRRRRQLPADDARTDAWLFRLVCTLREARDGMMEG